MCECVQKKEGGEYPNYDLTGLVLAGDDHLDDEPDLEADEDERGDEVDETHDEGPGLLLHASTIQQLIAYITDQASLYNFNSKMASNTYTTLFSGHQYRVLLLAGVINEVYWLSY